MPIEYRKFITRDMLKAEPDTLFVFGDNLLGEGYGGQAREMRGEPNAVGIPTKKMPSNAPDAFFRDADFEAACDAALRPLHTLLVHIAGGGTVVWPEDGIGTGLADLANKSPSVWRLICGLELLLTLYGVVDCDAENKNQDSELCG